MKSQLVVLMVVGQLIVGLMGMAAPSWAKTPLPTKADLGSKGSEQLVAFPDVELEILQPPGFDKATSFNGFQQSSIKASVALTSLPVSFRQISNGFNKKNLATRGMTLLSQQTIKIKNQPGLLLKVNQSAFGKKFGKWILVFGDDQKTNIVTASFLSKDAPKLSAPLKKVLLSVAPISSNTTAKTAPTLPFAVTAVEGLTLVQKMAGVGKMAAFTKDGNIPTAAPTDPLFLVAPSLGDVPVLDQRAFATKRLSGYPQTEISTVKSTKEITIDNLSGWEMVADGLDQKTKTPMKIYQVMLFPKQGGYVVMTGLVGDKQAEIYMPKFKSITLTYKNLVK
jgi:hypothetical protein